MIGNRSAFRWICVIALLALPAFGREGPPSSGEDESLLPEVIKRAAMRDPLYARAVGYLERFRRDDLGQAVRLLRRVIQIDSGFAPAHGTLAEARALRYLWGWDPSPDKLRSALEEGKEAVRLGSDAAEARVGLGLAYMAADRYTPALSEFDRAILLAPGSFRAHLYRGMLLRGLRRTTDLEREAARVLELAPASPLAYALLGDYHQDRRVFWKARDAYLTAAQLDQRLLWARLGLAAAYQKELNFAAAGKTYLLTEQDFPEESLRCRIMAASLLVASRDYGEAASMYERMPEKEELSPPLLRRLILAGRGYSLEKLGRIEQAEYYWTRLVDEFPPDFDGSVRDRELLGQAYEALIRYHESKGNVKKAESLLGKACSRPGMPLSLHQKLAERHLRENRPDRAVTALYRGVRDAPEDLDLVSATQGLLPVVRALAGARPSRTSRLEAEALVNHLSGRLQATKPEDHVSYLNLARSAALLELSDRALELLRLAVVRGYSGLNLSEEDPDLKSLLNNAEFLKMRSRPQ